MSYPNESELLKIEGLYMLDGCNDIGDEVIIETKQNTVQGQISYINKGKNELKVRYSSVDAGWPPNYSLQNCDIVSIRCYACCDDRYYEIPDCNSLTPENLVTLLGEVKPEGHLYIFSGDPESPDCVWKFKGFGDHTDPANWTSTFGSLAAQFPQMGTDELNDFVTWLSSVFTANGASFNADTINGKIVVTVTGGGTVGTISLVINYDDGEFIFNPGDGSGDHPVVMVAHGNGAPTGGPHDWFTYIDDVTGFIYINNNGTPMVLGTLGSGSFDTCANTVNCLVDNVTNPPARDEYVLDFDVAETDLDDFGPVIYNGSTAAAYSEISSISIADLAEALNNSPSNPEGWQWSISGNSLTLQVPHGDVVNSITYEHPTGGPQIENYSGPTTPGSTTPNVMDFIAGNLRNLGLIKFSTDQTRASIEASYSTDAYATVLWKDAAGITNLSVKAPGLGWFHKGLVPEMDVLSTHVTANDATLANGSAGPTTNVATIANMYSQTIPECARGVKLEVRLIKNSGNSLTDQDVTAEAYVSGKSAGNGITTIFRGTSDYPNSTAFSIYNNGTLAFDDYVTGSSEVVSRLAKIGASAGSWVSRVVLKGFIF